MHYLPQLQTLQVALANLQENPKLQPLLPTFSAFLRNLVGFSEENSHVVQRIPRIFNALMKNPHLHIESEVLFQCRKFGANDLCLFLLQHKCFLQLLQDLLLNYGGSKLDEEIFHLVSSISHILAKVYILRMF